MYIQLIIITALIKVDSNEPYIQSANIYINTDNITVHLNGEVLGAGSGPCGIWRPCLVLTILNSNMSKRPNTEF